MPIPPAPTPTQQTTIEGLVTLANTEATSVGNQIAVLDLSLASSQEAKTFYQGQYDFWHQYISAFELERRYLDGYYLTTPLVPADFTALQANSGRLFSTAQSDPVRIGEFDGAGGTAFDGTAEIPQYGPEADLRATLQFGFVGVTLPAGVETLTALTTASTTLDVQKLPGAGQVVIPLGKTVVLTILNAALIEITGVTETLVIPFPPTYAYTLNINILSLVGTVGIGATFTPNFLGFSNAERTSMVAANPAYQGILTDLRAQYLVIVTAFRDALNQQGLAIAQQTSEDVPDTAYLAARTQAQTDLTNYLVTGLVSNAGLTVVQTVQGTRSTASGGRVTWIAGRISSSSAYDERYTQTQRLHNRNDGSETFYQKTTAQKATLVAQQTACNARAANLAADIA